VERNPKESNPQIAKRAAAATHAVDAGWRAENFSTMHIRESDKRAASFRLATLGLGHGSDRGLLLFLLCSKQIQSCQKLIQSWTLVFLVFTFWSSVQGDAFSGSRRRHETFIKGIQAKDVGWKGPSAVPDLASIERVLRLFL
jgi:hypothetical protein